MSTPQTKTPVKTDTEQLPDLNINQYLRKERDRFLANQWKEQLYVQLIYGKQKQITIDKTDYNNRTISDADELELNKLFSLLNKVEQLNAIKFQEIGTDMKEIDIDKIKQAIDKLETDLNTVENDYFCKCCEVYYSIPRDVALKNKEMLSAYIAGRNYWKDLRVVGNTFHAIKNDTVTPQLLNKICAILTDRHYS